MDLGTWIQEVTRRVAVVVVAPLDIGRDLSCGKSLIDSAVLHNFESLSHVVVVVVAVVDIVAVVLVVVIAVVLIAVVVVVLVVVIAVVLIAAVVVAVVPVPVFVLAVVD